MKYCHQSDGGNSKPISVTNPGDLKTRQESVGDDLANGLSNGLPKKFVAALRGLFNILDDNQSGFIKLSDLEERWKAEEIDAKVPKGLIECLQSFQTSNELIDFERFCGAVKVCLLRGGGEGQGKSSPPLSSSSSSSTPPSSSLFGSSLIPGRYDGGALSSSSAIATAATTTTVKTLAVTGEAPAPAPSSSAAVLTINHELGKPQESTSNQRSNGLTGSSEVLDVNGQFESNNLPVDVNLRPPHPFIQNQAIYSNKTQSFDDMRQQQDNSKLDFRAKSMPLLRDNANNQTQVKEAAPSSSTTTTAFRHYDSDPKILVDAKSQRIPMRNKIINILKEWRNTVIQKSSTNPSLPSGAIGIMGPGPGPGNVGLSSTSLGTSLGSNIAMNLGPGLNSLPHPGLIPGPKPQVYDEEWSFDNVPASVSGRSRHGRRREARRHTVSSGIDMNTIKRLQQYEQEKEILLQGLEMIERGRDWYIKNINNIQGKIRFIGQAMANAGDYSLDANQERINFQAARILTVNQHLAALMDNSRGFPVHMNLALRPLLAQNQSRLHDHNRSDTVNNVTIQRLKEQNRLLTEEVSLKSEKITILEREKSALIRELFQSRSNTVQKSFDDNDDNTFM